MRKIKNANISQKDRIVCASLPDKLRFSYRAADETENTFLFDTDFSYSIFQYFRDHGRRDGTNVMSMTIGQAYRHPKYNKKLTKFFERLPKMIDYVLKEVPWDKQAVKTYQDTRTYSYEYDGDRVA